jgi:glutathione S-transferase
MMVRGIEALADGVTDAAVALFLERKRAPEHRSGDWMVLQEKALFRGLEALSEALGEKPWYLGNSMTLADVACGCTLGYLELRFPEIEWRTAHPNLAKHAEKLATRVSFKETVPVV